MLYRAAGYFCRFLSRRRDGICHLTALPSRRCEKVTMQGRPSWPPSAHRSKALGRRAGNQPAPAGPLQRVARTLFFHTFSGTGLRERLWLF
jgi:hypothetical protein